MLERVLEPELMDDPDEASLYDAMDHSAVNVRFVADLLDCAPFGNDILDLGTGTALIPIELCRQHAECRVMASDAAVCMLDVARYNVAIACMEHRIQLHHGDSKSLGFTDDYFDVVISNSLIHHVAHPESVIREMHRVCKLGGLLFVRDLVRPNTLSEVEHLVAAYTGTEPAASQQLFRQSLVAALTLEEVRQLVGELGYEAESVQMTSDRHWTWSAKRQ